MKNRGSSEVERGFETAEKEVDVYFDGYADPEDF